MEVGAKDRSLSPAESRDMGRSRKEDPGKTGGNSESKRQRLLDLSIIAKDFSLGSEAEILIRPGASLLREEALSRSQRWSLLVPSKRGKSP